MALTKPRIIELLLVTTVPTMVVAEQGLPSVWLMVATVVGGTFAAGGANAINMYVDRDIDAIMERTRNRPLVTGVIEPRNALIFAIGLEIVAFVWLWAFVNLLSAVLAVAACLFYVFVYTLWLKRTSNEQHRHRRRRRGRAGAHRLVRRDQLARLGAGRALRHHLLLDAAALLGPGHPVQGRLRRGRRAHAPLGGVAAHHRRAHPRLHRVAVALTLVFAPVADMGSIYWAAAVVLGAVFTAMAVRLLRDPTAQRAMRLFTWSITYITLLFGAMALDQLVRSGL